MYHESMTFNPEEFRRAMRQWATGVTVVSVAYQGIFHGMTVSSFTSLALHPPLVLIALEKGTRTHGMLEQAGFFGVTILAQDQWEISDRFAGRHTEHQDRFENLETFTLVSGAPLLAGGLAHFDCRVIHSHEAGTHIIFVGDVLATQTLVEGRPLLYYNQAYRGICDGDGSTQS
jgi:flavin reductase (DIM6/NTAB) family NADH-FMN oxidoreductase RutF